MKKIIVAGVMVILIVIALVSYEANEYEYYDLEDNYGISSYCKTTAKELKCLKDYKWITVKQYAWEA